jgi:hypothetical protein
VLGLYREGQIDVLDFVQKKAGKFANHANDLVWETLVQHRKLAFAPCSKHTLEKGHGNLWGDWLKGPFILSREDHNRKIRARKQIADISKYSFLKRTFKLWNQPPAGVLVTSPCKSHTFRKRVGKVIVSEEK